MNHKINFFILMNFLFLFTTQKLIFVETHFRNGAKAPMLNDDTSDFFKEEWLYPGELTGSGERMQYLLGFRNRIKYITDEYNFLSEKYDPHEILVQSTSANYTLVSASAQLQGLYPMDIGIGDYLTEEQEKYAVPGVDVSAPEIQEELEKIGNCSLPNSMTVVPVHMLHPLEKKMILYENEGCSEKTKENKKKNLEENSELKKVVENFNKNYATNLNNFYKNPEDKKYSFEWMNDFCETLIADFTDDRKFENFKPAGIDINILEKDCSVIREYNLKYYLFGDKNKNIVFLEASKPLQEMISYMQKRIDADIKGEKIEEQFLDFSRPKMLLISSEGSTLSAQQIFLINTFNLGDDAYKHPEYADQITFEVTRKDDLSKLTYKDYDVTYYFNDEKILVVNFDEFKNKVNKKIWDDEKINSFCNITNEDEVSNTFLILMIVWGVVIVLLIAISIVLCYKVYKKRSNLKEEFEV